MPRGPRGSARFWWQEMGAKGNSRLEPLLGPAGKARQGAQFGIG